MKLEETMETTINQEIILQFEHSLYEQEKSTVTVKKYCRDAQLFADYCAERPLTKDIVISYKQSLQDKGYAPTSVNLTLAAVNCFLKFMGHPDFCVRHLKVQRQIYCPEERELTKIEYFRLLEAAGKKKNGRLYAVLQAICGTGIRISELRFFTLEAVRTGRLTVRCKNKSRVVFIPSKLKALLLDHAKKAGISSGMIFITRGGKALDRRNVWGEMKALCQSAGVNEKKVFPHNLRKLFAKTFYEVDKDIAKLADVLGHSNINTTRIYIITSGAEHFARMENLGLVV